MIKKILSVLVILLGILVFTLPYLVNVVINNSTKANADYVKTISAEELKENQKRQATFDFSIVEDIDVNSTLIDIGKTDKNLILGQLLIPDLNLDLPIFKGLSKINLLAGAATMKDGQVMGKGNYSLAGHHMNNKALLFGGLMDIKYGSIIKLTNKITIYEYIIYEILVVPDTQIDVISDNIATKKGKPVISLMTCYHSSRTGKRFFALGELVKEYPYSKILIEK
jgi:sortase A